MVVPRHACNPRSISRARESVYSWWGWGRRVRHYARLHAEPFYFHALRPWLQWEHVTPSFCGICYSKTSHCSQILGSLPILSYSCKTNVDLSTASIVVHDRFYFVNLEHPLPKIRFSSNLIYAPSDNANVMPCHTREDRKPIPSLFLLAVAVV